MESEKAPTGAATPYELQLLARIAELEQEVADRTKFGDETMQIAQARADRITELEADVKYLKGENLELNASYSGRGYDKALADVLALPQEGAWEKPETGMALEVTPMWGVKVIRVSDIEALRGEG